MTTMTTAMVVSTLILLHVLRLGRSLVALGIAWVNGTPVSSFDRQDADRLLFFCSNQCKDQAIQNISYAHLSSWSASLTKDRTTGSIE
ncbi:hypothetical protein BDA96_01G179600 [Sorghum bicolor]|uniref:FLZ-type domain-containing protein n=1 Tax=Sorghum bicolor TaxID=4558 RepID=A0A921RXZ3_SORBI|nr:hypothetical protein BDA96_01G179600 [Sorghum bicolor]